MNERPAGTAGRLRVAYIMSRFPKLTETFVLFEILAMGELGVQVDIYPLLRQREGVIHPEARELAERAHYLPFASWAIARSQLWHLRRHPRRYLGTLVEIVRRTWGSLNFLVGGIGIFPKVAHAARLMQADGIAHVHCHFANHPAVAGLIVQRLAGIPFSFTAHGSDLHVDRHMLCTKVAAARFVVAISEDNRRLIETECPADAGKVEVLHCGVDTNVFKPRSPAAGSTRPQPFTIVAVGTLHEVKGHTVLVEACRILAVRGASFRCQIVGDGPDRARLASQISSAGLDGCVELLGPLPRAEVANLLNTADVLVAPSVPTASGKREGIPVVIMEAMASGLPVVASRLSGIPEIVEPGANGALVTPGNAGELADAIGRLMDDPEQRGRLARAARETALSRFNVRANATRLASLFADAAPAGRP